MLKKIKILFVVSSLSLLAISCASSKVIINQGYKKPSYNEPSMVIILKGNPVIDYDGDVEPEFGPGDQKTLITRFFRKQLAEDILDQTSIQEIRFDSCTANGYFDNNEININGNIEGISVLSNGGNYTCNYKNPEFVLTLSDIYIGTALETPYSRSALGSDNLWSDAGSTVSKKLTYKAQFFLFDNITREYIEYGYINESAQGFFPVITKEVWESVSSSFVSWIVSGVHF